MEKNLSAGGGWRRRWLNEDDRGRLEAAQHLCFLRGDRRTAGSGLCLTNPLPDCILLNSIQLIFNGLVTPITTE